MKIKIDKTQRVDDLLDKIIAKISLEIDFDKNTCLVLKIKNNNKFL